MARVTVEDCLRHVDNRFNLVLKAAKRAHQLELGAADPTVPLDNDKPTVLALREIAKGHDITKTRTEHDVKVDLVEFTESTVEGEAAVEGEGGQFVETTDSIAIELPVEPKDDSATE